MSKETYYSVKRDPSIVSKETYYIRQNYPAVVPRGGDRPVARCGVAGTCALGDGFGVFQ